MLLPEGVHIDGLSGALKPETGRYRKPLSELAGIFNDKHAYEVALREGDPLVYEVVEYRKEGSDLFFGTTIMHPGTVGDEYYMTRGHFHADRTMGEVYYTQSGSGVLLLESRDGRSEVVDMKPGVCAFIPPDWAHRSINVGADKLVFVWVCNTQAGHDYGAILSKGMRKLVMADPEKQYDVIDSPAFSNKRNSS
jgi:glucose-6-phosphate isomerase